MCCRVGKCCCCVNLRPGVIVIACFSLLGDALLLAWTSYVTYETRLALEKILEYGHEFREVSDLLPIGVFCLLVAFDVIHSVAILLHIMLLAGAITRRPRLVFGWVVAYAVLYVLFLLFSLFDVVTTYFFDTYHGLALTAGLLVHAGLMLYFWTVVHSYHLELEQQNGEGGPRCSNGKVYHTVTTGGVFPAHDTYGDDEGGFAMQPTAPPYYTRYAQEPPNHFQYSSTALGNVR